MDLTCFNCTSQVPSNLDAKFCPYCLTQIVCKNCNTPIVKGAVGCISCGNPIEAKSTKQSELNHIEFEQKGDSKKFKASFTDNVGHELVSTFGGMVGASSLKKKGQFALAINKTIGQNNSGTADTVDVDFTEEDDLGDALGRIFKVDGETLIFQTSNFKAKVKLNKEIRIAILTLLGYKYIHNSEEIKRQILTDTLKKFKLNSSAFRSWISKSEEIGQKSGSLIFLTPNGLTTAIEVLKEVVNPDVVEGTIAFSKTSSPRKRSSSDGEATSKKSSSTSSPKALLLALLDDNFFSQRRSLMDIVTHIKDNKAITLTTADISGHMGKLLGKKGLKREKGTTGNYEYFI